jgi:outer membrane receptor protein involved in Fe transport
MRFSSVIGLFAVFATSVVVARPVAGQVVPPTRAAGQAPAGQGRIMGTALNVEGQPLPAVAITLRKAADSSMVTGVLTSKDGKFLIEGLPIGRYTIRVSLIGYKPRSSEVIDLTADRLTFDLGQIKLEVAAVELNALEAVAERSAAVVVEADRTTYNTKSMPAAAGTAVDVLRAVPELEVDVNDNVKLRGNQSVAIHLNGRPTPMTGEQLTNFLKQLPGNRIDRVEVMPNPSAKHDPEGMGGIVNIVLKQNVDLGLSGSVSANMSTRNRQYFNGRLNYQKGRLTLFTGAGVNTYSDESWNYDLRENLVTQPLSFIEQNSTSESSSRGANLDWTAEFKVGKQAHFWSNAWMYGSRYGNDGRTEYGILDEARAVRDRYDRMTDAQYFYGSMNVGLGFKQIFVQQKEELTIDGRYSSGANDSETDLRRLFMLAAGAPVSLPEELTFNDIEQGNGSLSLQADYYRPLGPGRIDVGYRAYLRDQDNDNQLRIFDTPVAADPSDQMRTGYVYEEVFHSLYATLGRTFGKFGINAGLRAEFANTHFESRVTGHDFDRDYQSVFPSLNLSYSPKQGRTIRFLYSKRISRPPPFYMDPVVPSTDPLNITVGNPDLEPMYGHSLSMDFSMTGNFGTLRIAPFYRINKGGWERIRTVDTMGVATNRFENALSAESYGSNLTISLRSTGKLSGSVNLSVYRDVRDGTNISSAYRRDAVMYSLNGSLGYKITPTLTAQSNAFYFPQQYILQGRASGYTYTSLGLRQQVWGTKGSISLNINDPLNLYRFNSSTSDATYRQESKSSYKSRVATLGFTFNFGKPPQQMSRRTADDSGAGETIRVR